MQSGIPIDKAREIVKIIKNSKMKVQAAIQGEQLRVTGKSRDDLQAVMTLLRGRQGARHRHAVHELPVDALETRRPSAQAGRLR